MTPRERVLCALRHDEPDRVPIFFGTSGVTTTNTVAYDRLKRHLGLETETRTFWRALQYALLDEEVMQRFHSDGRPLIPGPAPSTLARDLGGNNGPFMSPRMFREFIFPGLKAECDAVHAEGKYLIKHTDGQLWPVLDLMLEAGIDGWQGIQPEIGMTLPALQERYGGRLCFWEGVSMPTLIDGTEAQVAEEVRGACDSAPAAGGLVITCANSVMVGVKYQNYLAQLRAARKCGQRHPGART